VVLPVQHVGDARRIAGGHPHVLDASNELCTRRDRRVVERLVARKVRGTFNLATGTSVSLRQILATIRETLGVDFEVAHLPANVERNFDMCYDTARLSAALGEFDFSPLQAGIRSYL